MKRVVVVAALLAACGGSGGGAMPIGIESLPFEIGFCHVSRVCVDQQTGRVFFIDEPEESPDIVTAADCDPLQWTTLSPGTGRRLARVTAMTWDSRARRLILYERFTGDLLGLRGTGGSPTLLGNVAAGGLDPAEVQRLAFDPTGNRVLAVDRERDLVLALRLGSGQWSTVSSAGSGAAFVFPRVMAVDPTRNRLLVCDTGLDHIVAVDLVTGARTDFEVPGISMPGVIDIDVAGDRAFVADRDSLVEIELATGLWELLATGGGGVEDMDYDACGNRLLFNAVISVTAFDLATRTSALFAR